MSQTIYFTPHNHDDNICIPIIPKKAYPSDVGYDLTLIRHVKNINSVTDMYDSGISVTVPDGFYIEIVPRSSLSKFGYIMANSIGIIDPSYTGTLRVVLTKVVPDADPISLPFARFQLIPRKLYSFVTEISSEPQRKTIRGDGGFGSTD
jgi:dUTP pyrophosphatase